MVVYICMRVFPIVGGIPFVVLLLQVLSYPGPKEKERACAVREHNANQREIKV